VLRWTAARFEERRQDTPRLDAEVLIAAALGVARLQLYVQFDRPLDQAELAAIRDSVRRRQAGEPVAYIVGKKEFFGLELAVDARVLVPRPDTETLVDEALARLAERPPEAPAPRIADVGTGSGAIAVTLAKQRPAAEVLATDISAEALEVARENARRHGVTVTFLEGDLDAPLALHAPLDLITANLPYIPTGDLAGLPPEVRHEPRRALDGGADGLALVRRLVAAASALLAPGGALALEVGAGQAPSAAELCRTAGLTDVRLRRDLGSIDRVVSGRRP
jgi:release factor glutamine methyltransferase